jgi:cytochrome c peroxidase
MKKQIKFILSTAIILTLVLASCSEDEATSPTDEFETTTYTLVMPSNMPAPILPPDNPLTYEGIALGKALFFEKMMSIDGTVSCGSCHNQSNAFTDNEKIFSEGIKGKIGDRNSMPIFNMFYHTKGFFWDGRAKLLRDQSLGPIENPLEMGETLENVVNKLQAESKYRNLFYKAFGDSTVSSLKMSLAMEQFMLTLVSGNSKFDKVERGEAQFSDSEMRGKELFFTEFETSGGARGADCFHCHATADFSNHEFMNNGLDSESEFTDLGRAMFTKRPTDNAKFKTPSLRNVAVSGPYMHDGRFATLTEVIEHYNSGIKESPTLDVNIHGIKDGMNLTEQEKQDLIAFLNTLTDEVYLNNEEFKELK